MVEKRPRQANPLVQKQPHQAIPLTDQTFGKYSGGQYNFVSTTETRSSAAAATSSTQAASHLRAQTNPQVPTSCISMAAITENAIRDSYKPTLTSPIIVAPLPTYGGKDGNTKVCRIWK